MNKRQEKINELAKEYFIKQKMFEFFIGLFILGIVLAFLIIVPYQLGIEACSDGLFKVEGNLCDNVGENIFGLWVVGILMFIAGLAALCGIIILFYLITLGIKGLFSWWISSNWDRAIERATEDLE